MDIPVIPKDHPQLQRFCMTCEFETESGEANPCLTCRQMRGGMHVLRADIALKMAEDRHCPECEGNSIWQAKNQPYQAE